MFNVLRYMLFYCYINEVAPFSSGTHSIQFNSKTLFKDGDPVSLQLIIPGAIRTCKQIQPFFIHIYKKSDTHRQTQLTLSYKKYSHKHSYLTYSMYIHTCTFTTLLSFMNKKEQYIVNNKHIEQERS